MMYISPAAVPQRNQKSSPQTSQFIEIPQATHPPATAPTLSKQSSFLAPMGIGCGQYSHGAVWDNTTYPCVSYMCRDGVVLTTYHGKVMLNHIVLKLINVYYI